MSKGKRCACGKEMLEMKERGNIKRIDAVKENMQVISVIQKSEENQVLEKDKIRLRWSRHMCEGEY